MITVSSVTSLVLPESKTLTLTYTSPRLLPPPPRASRGASETRLRNRPRDDGRRRRGAPRSARHGRCHPELRSLVEVEPPPLVRPVLVDDHSGDQREGGRGVETNAVPCTDVTQRTARPRANDSSSSVLTRRSRRCLHLERVSQRAEPFVRANLDVAVHHEAP